jgi:hypothetical protein
MAVSFGAKWDESSITATYGIVPHKEFEILDRQKLVDFENGRTRREAHQILACFVGDNQPDCPSHSVGQTLQGSLTYLPYLSVAMMEKLDELEDRGRLAECLPCASVNSCL